MATHTPGERIAELRKTYSVDRKALAERSGVPEELIRRIEDEGLIPDLAPLLKIARALGVRLGTLLDDHNELGPLVTRADKAGESVRFITGIPSNTAAMTAVDETRGLSFKALASDKGGRHMEPFIVDVESNAEQDKNSHEGEEFIYVLTGTIQIDYGKDSLVLNVGDSIYYDSIVPHRVLAANNVRACILAVIYTPT
jgi:transcriptional regulator with XRE-family HTH domain